MREITFENGEELTEEGLPFMLLFHKSDDTTSTNKYKDIVAKELYHEKGNTPWINSQVTMVIYFLGNWKDETTNART